MVAFVIPNDCIRCGKRSKNMTSVAVRPILPQKVKGKLVYSYTNEFYLCKECVDAFNEWMRRNDQYTAETVTTRNEFDEKL